MSAHRRVLHVVRPAAGGIRQHVLHLLAHVDRARFMPSLAAPLEFLHDLPPDVGLDAAFPLDIAPWFSPLSDLCAALRLARLVPRHADVVHAHGLRAAWVTALAHRLRPFPFIFTAHNLVGPAGRLTRLGLRFAGQRASEIIAISHAVAEGLIAAGIAPTKITVIPNGIEVVHFEERFSLPWEARRLEIMPQAFVTGCIARLSPEKGVDVLLQAVAFRPDITVKIAGDGPEREALVRAAPPNVQFLGRILDTRPFLAALDVLAIPSRKEGQGIVALEAMAAGVPIVASRVGGLAEMLTDGETALLVPPDDSAALAKAITRLQNDAPLRERLVTQAEALVREKYDVRQMAQALMAVYEGI